MASATRSKGPARGRDDINDTRAAILQAAIDILRREGAGALTVRSVAAAAGCSTTGVYTWFGGKNGLVDAIFIDGFERFGRAVNTTDPKATAAANLHQRALDYRRWALDNPTHYMVMFGHAVPDYEPTPAAMIASLSTFEPLVAATAAAVAVGHLEGDPTDLARHLWASIHGYVSLEIACMDMGDTPAQRVERYNAGLERTIEGCRPHH